MNYIDIGLSFLIADRNVGAVDELDPGKVVDFLHANTEGMPTIDMINEIKDKCTSVKFGDTYILYGPNGKGIYFPALNDGKLCSMWFYDKKFKVFTLQHKYIVPPDLSTKLPLRKVKAK